MYIIANGGEVGAGHEGACRQLWKRIREGVDLEEVRAQDWRSILSSSIET